MRSALLVALVLVFCAGPPHPAPEPEPCDWSAQGAITLSDRDAPDLISASVSGPSCESAILILTIRTSEGRVIHRFDAPLPVFFSASGDPSMLPENAEAEARSLVEGIVQRQPARTVGSLPSFAPGEIDDGLRYQQYLLPENEVTRLADQPVFRQPAGFQYGLELTFDPRAGAIVRVLESWR